MSSSIPQQVKFAIRSLRRAPVFTTVAILSLAFAISLNTTAFAIVDALFWPRYPIRSQNELYRIRFNPPLRAVQGGAARYEAMQHRASDLVHHARFFASESDQGWFAFRAQIETKGRVVSLGHALTVDPGFFEFLGVRPYRGRFFTSLDQLAIAGEYGILSYPAWHRLAHGAEFHPLAVLVNGRPVTIIGVLPDRVERLIDADLLVSRPAVAAGCLPFQLIRLHRGMRGAEASAELTTINARLAKESGTSPGESNFTLQPLVQVSRPLNDFHTALLVAVFAVLMLACANVSNLQLARGLARARELAVRTALGATQRDLVGLLLVENALVALAGGLAGTLVALWAIAGIRGTIPPSVQGLGFIDPQLSWRVFAFAVVITSIVVIGFGLWPAVRTSRTNIDVLLKAAATATGPRADRRYYSVLIVGEIAAPLSLCIGATLLFGASQQLHELDFGYDTHNLVASSLIVASRPQEPIAVQVASFVQHLEREPATTSVAARTQRQYANGMVSVDDPMRPGAEYPMPMESYDLVTADLIRTLRVHILRGRDFSANDDGATPSAIIDSIAAARWWPGVNPVGRMIKLGDRQSAEPWIRVIGVSRHVLFRATSDASVAVPEVFVLARIGEDRDASEHVEIIARVSRDPAAFLVSMQRLLAPDTRFASTQLWDALTGYNALRDSHDFVATMFVGFSSFGLLLAMIGIYGVVAHSVGQRRREFGVRLALGATGRDV